VLHAVSHTVLPRLSSLQPGEHEEAVVPAPPVVAPVVL